MEKIINIKAKENYILYLKFNDGVEGNNDLSKISRIGVFELWNDLEFFKSVKINEISGATSWSKELDIDVLNQYLKLTKQTFEEYLINKNVTN